jgi:hypothetical protein
MTGAGAFSFLPDTLLGHLFSPFVVVMVRSQAEFPPGLVPDGFKVTRFERTPLLPTYVLGVWVGAFERITEVAKAGQSVNFFVPADRVQVSGCGGVRGPGWDQRSGVGVTFVVDLTA